MAPHTLEERDQLVRVRDEPQCAVHASD
jgi:hypothetical protein